MSLRDMTGWILLVAALVVGVATFFLVRGYLSSREDQIRRDLAGQAAKTARVVVASKNLASGAVISESDMAVGELPAQYVSGRSVRARDFKHVKGRVLNRPMSSGEPLLADFVVGLVVERFSDLLEKGQRAVSLDVAALETHSGMLLPGDYVDLFVLLDAKKGSRQKRLEPVLQRVKVLAAGRQPLRARDQTFQRLPERDDKYSQITVGVPLADAERLVLARDAGEMVYLLRNSSDKRRGVANVDGLFGPGNQDGYWYISNASPQGAQRDLNDAKGSGSSAGGLSLFSGAADSSGPENEVATQEATPEVTTLEKGNDANR